VEPPAASKRSRGWELFLDSVDGEGMDEYMERVLEKGAVSGREEWS